MCIKIVKRVVFVGFCLMILLTSIIIPTAVSANNSDIITVVVDAGHGGLDAGVSSESGVKESDVVLVLSKTLGEYMESGGFKVVYTRKNKGALVAGNFHKRKDMEKRLKIIEEAQPSFVISLHLNAYSDKSRRGIQVFFGKEDSRSLACTMQDVLNDEFNLPAVNRAYSVLTADKYLLTKVSCPSVIIECGFLSNPIDEQNLLDDGYRYQLARTIFDGVLKWCARN